MEYVSGTLQYVHERAPWCHFAPTSVVKSRRDGCHIVARSGAGMNAPERFEYLLSRWRRDHNELPTPAGRASRAASRGRRRRELEWVQVFGFLEELGGFDSESACDQFKGLQGQILAVLYASVVRAMQAQFVGESFLTELPAFAMAPYDESQS
jgi:hypothetical protein